MRLSRGDSGFHIEPESSLEAAALYGLKGRSIRVSRSAHLPTNRSPSLDPNQCKDD